jgi:4-hydroxythreonine-4-phosphate dehydrogenase
MINEDIRVALQTHHIPLNEVSGSISKAKILESLETLNDILIKDFDKEKPLIAVLGLNPHAGDDGVIGNEEIEILLPAIEEAKKKGIFVNGPFPSDSFWGTLEYKKYDIVLAMYHDQALIPFKLLAFVDGVNYTGGLPFVRTSPDHGTGYDIVGKNVANQESFLNAIFAAVNITKNRLEYNDARKNALVKRAKPSEEIDE